MGDLFELAFGQERRRFGDAIRRARVSAGFSQRKLARLAGLNQSTISRLEAGTIGGMRFGTLMRLLHALGIREVRMTGTPALYRVL